jgi:hypothetical protein
MGLLCNSAYSLQCSLQAPKMPAHSNYSRISSPLHAESASIFPNLKIQHFLLLVLSPSCREILGCLQPLICNSACLLHAKLDVSCPPSFFLYGEYEYTIHSTVLVLLFQIDSEDISSQVFSFPISNLRIFPAILSFLFHVNPKDISCYLFVFVPVECEDISFPLVLPPSCRV